jgi:hypothetical protein
MRGTNTKLQEVPNIPCRSTKTDIFQEGSAGLKATIHVNKRRCIKVVSFYVKNVYLISIRQSGTIKNMREKTTEKEANFCWMRSNVLASVDVREFQTTEPYSNLHLTNVKYSIYKQPREENLKVMEQISLRASCIQKIRNQHDTENIILNKKTSIFLILVVCKMAA